MDDELAAAQELTRADLLRKLDEGEPARLSRGFWWPGVTPEQARNMFIDCRAV